jgi:diguanylate cyclase (GGDEF)-like protein
MTAPGLSRAHASPFAYVSAARFGDWMRVGSGAALALAVAVVALAAGPQAGLDPAPAFVLAAVVGAALGGVRGAAVGTLVAMTCALFYYTQPPLVGGPGNGARVLLLFVSTLAAAWLVASLRDLADRPRPRAVISPSAAQRFQDFAATVTNTPDDALHDTIVREGAAVVGADMAVLTVLDPRTGRHTVRAAYGTSNAALGVEVLPGVGITGQSLRDRRLVVTGGTPPEPADADGGLLAQLVASMPSRRLLAAERRRSARQAGPALASVAAVHGGRVTATLTIGRAAPGPSLSEDDRLMLAMASQTIGLTVSNWLLRRQLKESALRDPLTGLYNRAYLDAALDQLLALRRRTPVAERRPLSLILFDIDDFRTFNETHGRKTGDAAVRAVAALLRGRFRQSDVVARISGDGFLAVLEGADADVCARAAEEIRRQAQELTLGDLQGTPVHVSLSAGCATFRDDTESADTIIHAVEAALDTARWSGPGAIVAI